MECQLVRKERVAVGNHLMFSEAVVDITDSNRIESATLRP